MDTNLEINPTLPKIGKKLLRRLSSGELTMGEFEKECDYWMMDFIEEHHRHPAPSAPQEILDYRQRKQENPNYHLSSEFWHTSHIAEYVKQSKNVFSMNWSNFYWLSFMARHIPKEDSVNQMKIRKILNEYKNW